MNTPEPGTARSIPELTAQQKSAFDAMESIRASYYKFFSDRRELEWKMSMAIWTVVAIYTSALVVGSGSPAIAALPLVWGTGFGASAMVLIHGGWLLGTSGSNDLDKDQSFEAADEMRKSVGLDWSKGVTKRIDDVRAKAKKSRFRWSQATQLAVTLLLGCLATGAAFYRGYPNTDHKAECVLQAELLHSPQVLKSDRLRRSEHG